MILRQILSKALLVTSNQLKLLTLINYILYKRYLIGGLAEFRQDLEESPQNVDKRAFALVARFRIVCTQAVAILVDNSLNWVEDPI